MDRKDAGLYVSVQSKGIQMKRTDGAKTPPPRGPVKTITLGELSAYLHVHRSTVYRMVKRHEIPAFHVGGDPPGQPAHSRAGARMSFPPRCYFCRRAIWWPLGIRVFRGSTGWHIAHRSCAAVRVRRKSDSVYYTDRRD